jgi:predicted GNAT family acetyltransferase
MDIRLLANAAAVDLEAFLVRHRDTSMSLRSNARKAGLEYAGQPFQATYVAGYAEGNMLGVVAHAWDGMLLLQAPDGVEELAMHCVRESGRPVTGLSGPLAQVRRARRALNLEGAPASVEADQVLYVLDLAELVLPEALVEGRVTCRNPLPRERDLLCSWRQAYDVEVLGMKNTAQARDAAARLLDQQIAEGTAWVAVARAEPVSLSAFSAVLPDMVQLDGIYTPPRLRGRGYARAAIAGSLQVVREQGVDRAALFTPSRSAARSYEAVGFQRAGSYGLVLLK